MPSTRDEILRLAPWHIDVEVEPGLRTGLSLGAPGDAEARGGMSLIDPRAGFHHLLDLLYPGGLGGRAVLDCGCNCAAYLVFSKEKGAGRCFALAVRERWIEQARFLLERRGLEGVTVEVGDLYGLPGRAVGRFDLTLFLGLFYHLPDPIGGLRIAADRTDDVLVLNTRTRSDLPDGLLSVHQEAVDLPLSGVHGLSWLPTGPLVLKRLLRWLGFRAFRCTWWIQETSGQGAGRGRLEVVAAREPGRLEDLPRTTASRNGGLR